MLKAELGDILYYIIFAVVILAGFLEKIAKSKRQQQQAGAPRPPQPDDDFEDVEAQPSSSPRQAPPKSLEEMMKRMLETVETPEQKQIFYPETAQSLEEVSDKALSSEYVPLSGRYFHHPEEVHVRKRFGYEPILPVIIEEEEKVVTEFHEFEFDIRQAVIASEILNKKY